MDLKISDIDLTPGKGKKKKKKGTTLAGRYDQLKTNRDPFLQRGRDCSKVTIPSICPDSNQGDHGKLKTPWQSTGARGIAHLSHKLLITLLPPNTPFFKLEIDSLALQIEEQGPEIKTELDTALVKVEQATMTMLETMSARASLNQAFRQLLVTGNVLLYVLPDGIRVIHLQDYCVVRDPMGHVTEILIEEEVYPEALPDGFLPDQKEEETLEPTKKSIKVHTCVKLENGVATWYQEAKGKEIPNTYGRCPENCSPWIVLRYEKLDSEDYGRSHTEQYYGDLTALESLYQAVIEAAAAASKILFLCNPNGTTRPRTLSSAANGAIVQGNAADVTVVQANKQADLQIANSTIDRIEGRLQFAFLLNSAIQRPGERVTAEEIRYMAQELEASIGGFYSILTQELQLPLVRRLIYMLQKKGKLPEFPNSQETGEPLVLPKAVTGLEGIGRGDDMNKLTEFLGVTQQVLGPEIAQQYVNYEEALRRLAASASIDTTNLIKTSEQLQQEAAAAQAQAQQQQQEQQMMEMMKSSAASKVADNFTQPGSPYGPQFSGSEDGAAGSIPNSLPNLRAAAQGLPSGPVQEGGEV
tara:strand:+ start:1124 stop:2875 length:1752 start_codon:yes stop_codon:yes gene_type:complete